MEIFQLEMLHSLPAPFLLLAKPPISSENFQQRQAVKLTTMIPVFQNSNLLLERANFIISNNIVSCYP